MSEFSKKTIPGYSVKNHRLLKDGLPVSYRESRNHKGQTMNPIGVIIHYTASDGLAGTIDWLCTPHGDKSVSAHFVVAKNGVTWQLGPCNRVLWHAGNSIIYLDEETAIESLNRYTIGIENMGYGKQGEWPDAQIDANIGILIALHRAYDVQFIAGHSEVSRSGKVDPGKFYPWDRVYDGLAAVGIVYE